MRRLMVSTVLVGVVKWIDPHTSRDCDRGCDWRKLWRHSWPEYWVDCTGRAVLSACRPEACSWCAAERRVSHRQRTVRSPSRRQRLQSDMARHSERHNEQHHRIYNQPWTRRNIFSDISGQHPNEAAIKLYKDVFKTGTWLVWTEETLLQYSTIMKGRWRCHLWTGDVHQAAESHCDIVVTAATWIRTRLTKSCRQPTRVQHM